MLPHVVHVVLQLWVSNSRVGVHWGAKLYCAVTVGIWELLTAFVPALLRVIQLFKTFPVSLGSDNAITVFCLYSPPPPPPPPPH